MSVTLIEREVENGVLIVDCKGRITLGEGSDSLRQKIDDLVIRNKTRIILNLYETSYVDSSGIGELVSGFTSLHNRGATLKLLSMGQRVKDLLQITKLYTVFEVHDDETTAIRSFC